MLRSQGGSKRWSSKTHLSLFEHEWFDELVRAHQWQNESEKLALHSLGEPSGLPAVPLPFPLLELSQQLERRSSERVKFEEAGVEQVEAAFVKPEESKVKKYPGLAQELQVKKRRPLPLAVKKSQLLVKFRMSTSRPSSGVPPALLAVRGRRCLSPLWPLLFQSALALLPLHPFGDIA